MTLNASNELDTKLSSSTTDTYLAPLAAVSNPSATSLPTSSHLLLTATAELIIPGSKTDKKNHRILSMIFFVLGMLVMLKVTHF